MSPITRTESTYPNRPPSPQRLVLGILQRPPRIPHNTVNRERRQSHRRHTLENGPLRHHRPIILNGRNPAWHHFTPGDHTIIPTILESLSTRRIPRHLLHALDHPRRASSRHHIPVLLLIGIDLRGRVDVVFRVQHLLVAHIGLVPFVRNIAGQVEPGDSVGALDEVGMGDGAEGLADVGGVGYVAVGGEHDGADAGCVGGIAEGGIGCVLCSEV